MTVHLIQLACNEEVSPRETFVAPLSDTARRVSRRTQEGRVENVGGHGLATARQANFVRAAIDDGTMDSAEVIPDQQSIPFQSCV